MHAPPRAPRSMPVEVAVSAAGYIVRWARCSKCSPSVTLLSTTQRHALPTRFEAADSDRRAQAAPRARPREYRCLPCDQSAFLHHRQPNHRLFRWATVSRVAFDRTKDAAAANAQRRQLTPDHWPSPRCAGHASPDCDVHAAADADAPAELRPASGSPPHALRR